MQDEWPRPAGGRRFYNRDPFTLAREPLGLLLEIAVSLLALPASYLATRFLVGYLKRRGLEVPDAHKEGLPRVSRPGGPAILLALAVTGIPIYLLSGDLRALTFVLVAFIAGSVGLVDDLKTLSGPVKVALLFGASLPILLLGTYSPRPTLPFVGHLRITIIYPILVLLAIPITANTFNMIDVYNGLLTGFAALASLPLLVAFAIKGDWVMVAVTLAFELMLLGFYPFHRYPSRIFPGDSGSLAMGAAYGAIVISGSMEVVGIVALIPAILNSFFVLSSVKGFIEHRDMKKRPVKLRDDFLLEASTDPDAPMTLTRMVLAGGPLDERGVTTSILTLSVFSVALSLVTFAMMWW
jgi:UDP-GlcNAc:undecaprenyl-phosphate GlcNAc-1-phosphate transferase